MATKPGRRRSALAQASREGVLAAGLKGVERECLRVTPRGRIAQTPHPRELGSALTHPYIKTDYSEALLELITPPAPSLDETYDFLHALQVFCYANLRDEYLWAPSMPPWVEGDESIPIAWYGTSNSGMMRHIYRRGLAWRYGRLMQSIAGVHFNYSLPAALWEILQAEDNDERPLVDYSADLYFGLIRNFHRLGWLVLYLFGASPAMSATYMEGRRDGFESLDGDTLYQPYATTLRMSDVGYRNRLQSELDISYNSLEAYVSGLRHATSTAAPRYAALGTRVDGEWRQLNTHILQIENEYYSIIRPKQTTRSGERPISAMQKRGVEYIEVRALDLNPYSPMGIERAGGRFIEALLLYCLREDSPPATPQERRECEHNQDSVAREGRRPGLVLTDRGRPRPLRDWALTVMESVGEVAALLDQAAGGDEYVGAFEHYRAMIEEPERTPSAAVLGDIRAHGESFVDFGLRLSEQHAKEYRQTKLDPRRQADFAAAAMASLREQAALESDSRMSLESFIENYFADRQPVGSE